MSKGLSKTQVKSLIRGAQLIGRHRHRDATLILLMYKHGLRVGEVVNLNWSDVNFATAQMYIRRLKNGISNHHPIYKDEIRVLRKLQRLYPDSSFIFCSEHHGPLNENTVRGIIKRAGQLASLPFPCHPHQLRHGCGYYLANKGTPLLTIKNYLGHRDVQHTVQYCEMSSAQFQNLWG